MLQRFSSVFVAWTLSLSALFAQETRRAEIVDEDDVEANVPVVSGVPETEEAVPGSGTFSAEDLELQDVPQPPAIPNDLFIPEPAAVSANSYDPADLPPEVPLDQTLGGDTAIVASWQTQTNARTLLLTVPAPRGQIVDRNGYCIAYNEVGFYYSIQFPRWDDPLPKQILAYARQRVEFLDKRTPDIPWSIKDEAILDHYKNRRWIPLINPRLVKRSDWEDVQKEMLTGIKLQPTYYRSYPHQSMGAHFMGYVSKKTRTLPTGPISIGEPITIELEGRTGLEKTYEEYLAGEPGEINVIFDADGNKLSEDIRRNPVEGKHVVLTLEREFQEIAESSLRSNRNAGAVVIMDVWDGDIIAMASYPTFNPNSFVPAISQKDYNKLIEDKRNPLYARAYQGQYPPASTFKVPVALAALETDLVGPYSEFNCTAYYKPPGSGRAFPNWHRSGEGMMNVRRALKRSCNTYFYRAANKIGADPILSMAARLGFGSKAGLPVEGESSGLLPSHEYMQREYGYRLVGGALANLSIGQGKILATPVQIARAMCAVANGQYLPKARLVKHIQDLDGNIVEAFPIEKESTFSVNPGNLKAVHAGMRGVVADGDGTGKRADIGSPRLVGKTGTGQWSETRNVALFAGFVPEVNPEYAYVVVYEGNPGQGVSGGRQAAPIVSSVFRQIYSRKRARGDKIGAPRSSQFEPDKPPKAEAVEEKKEATSSSSRKSSSSKSKPRAKKKPTPKPGAQETRKVRPAPAPAPPKKKEGFLQRLFKKRS
ncbi:MAG: penicillin-binding protein 2 [Verrucomicrobiales bacterium]|jgi:penicillin-binding protein 2